MPKLTYAVEPLQSDFSKHQIEVALRLPKELAASLERKFKDKELLTAAIERAYRLHRNDLIEFLDCVHAVYNANIEASEDKAKAAAEKASLVAQQRAVRARMTSLKE